MKCSESSRDLYSVVFSQSLQNAMSVCCRVKFRDWSVGIDQYHPIFSAPNASLRRRLQSVKSHLAFRNDAFRPECLSCCLAKENIFGRYYSQPNIQIDWWQIFEIASSAFHMLEENSKTNITFAKRRQVLVTAGRKSENIPQNFYKSELSAILRDNQKRQSKCMETD